MPVETLADLGVRAAIRRHDRSGNGCYVRRELMAAEAGLSLYQLDRSLSRLRHSRQIWSVGKRQGHTVWKTWPNGSQTNEKHDLWLYEWIMARVEISDAAKFIFCHGADQASKAHGSKFRLTTRKAAQTLSISPSEVGRAFAELIHWRLILPQRRSQYCLLDHPWHKYFLQELARIHRLVEGDPVWGVRQLGWVRIAGRGRGAQRARQRPGEEIRRWGVGWRVVIEVAWWVAASVAPDGLR